MNDLFCESVSGSSLRTEDKHAGHHIEVRILNQSAILRQNIEQVQMLPLVFVKSLDLHIEERVRTDGHSTALLNHIGETHLVAAFDVHELLPPRGVINVLFQIPKFIEMFRPVISDASVNQTGQFRVTGLEPATRGDSVRFV